MMPCIIISHHLPVFNKIFKTNEDISRIFSAHLFPDVTNIMILSKDLQVSAIGV